MESKCVNPCETLVEQAVRMEICSMVESPSSKWKLCPFCPRVEINAQQIKTLQSILPATMSYLICQYDSISTQDGAFKVVLRSAAATTNDLELWLREFKIKSMTTMRVLRTNRCSVGTHCNKVFRCQHNTRPKSETADRRRSSKNTGCPAELVVVLKTLERFDFRLQTPRQVDLHIPDYPLRVRLRFEHNHPINIASSLRHRDVGPEAASRIMDLLSEGHTPSAALHRYKTELQERHGSQYVYKAGDRHHCPDLQWCYHMHQKLFKQNYGDHTLLSPDDQLKDLKEHIERYNRDLQTDAARVLNGISDAEDNRNCSTTEDFVRLTTNNGEVIIALCTPFMKRVHRLLRSSAEIVFMDASGNVDRQNAHIFLLLTHSVAGGLPLGALIVTSENQATITAALRLYNTLLDSTCYHGRGSDRGPQVFMTDDSAAERNAIHEVYPGSARLLCTFHILQAFWRFIWNNRSVIDAKEDRSALYSKMRDLVYASSSDRLNTLYEAYRTQDSLLIKHPRVLEYIVKTWDRRKDWAISLRRDLPTRDNNTNNYCEAAMRVLKDNILLRTRAFNIQQLVDFVANRLDAYYRSRLLDVANNRFDHVLESRFMPAAKQVTMNDIVRVSETEFDVPKETISVTAVDTSRKFYRVDISIDMCSCSRGRTGGPCIHQQAVVQHFKLRSWNTMPVNDPCLRQLLCVIATGDRSVSLDWFRSLKPTDEVSYPMTGGGYNYTQATSDDLIGTSSTIATTSSNSAAPARDHTANYVSTAKRFRSSIETILEKYKEYPMSLESALAVFCTRVENIGTVRDLAAALAGFAFSPSGSEDIDVQPSSVGRRKMAVGGRRRIFAGRPPKSRHTVEHGYAGVTSRAFVGALARRVVHPRRNIHCLAETVARDQRLGGTHSAK